jgi:septal ring factor EnvC (AmiA/AmiB activator)
MLLRSAAHVPRQYGSLRRSDAARSTRTAEIEAMRKQLESGLKAMEAGIAARNAVIEELKVGLEHERGERTKLAAELAEARKGWLERLLQAIRRR